MKTNDILQHTLRALGHELGHDRPRDTRPLWQRRLSGESQFCQALVGCGYMTEGQMQRAALRYRLGMSRDGGVIFWQIDEHDRLRDGKIMYYRPDCHRDHDRNPTWVSYQLRRAGMLPPDFTSDHCLFGLHLSGPAADPGQASAVAVVESEKTAVIMSELQPQYLWLATGGKTELNVAKLEPLAGRRVILFPDTDPVGDTYRQWYEVAQAATDVFGRPVTVSSILEQRATKAQKAAKIDIVDMLFATRK